MTGNSRVQWHDIATSRPDDDLMVLLFDRNAAEPVWPGYHDGTQWVYAEGVPANPTHWADLPWGPDGDTERQNERSQAWQVSTV